MLVPIKCEKGAYHWLPYIARNAVKVFKYYRPHQKLKAVIRSGRGSIIEDVAFEPRVPRRERVKPSVSAVVISSVAMTVPSPLPALDRRRESKPSTGSRPARRAEGLSSWRVCLNGAADENLIQEINKLKSAAASDYM
ncbi:hypothetical protein EVAR_16741_1 [Eumeta japonica]|uniref:Uncharacterized protein n=1 Tax=Eumeta variegata TaxID=151549 RepID=A0A4C1UMH4_EUMVA|nr:hypothetical protein EVAR_16741_1 [Eumeta japonica]